jgi:hypothetical protein
MKLIEKHIELYCPNYYGSEFQHIHCNDGKDQRICTACWNQEINSRQEARDNKDLEQKQQGLTDTNVGNKCSDAEIFKPAEPKFEFQKDEYIKSCMNGSIYQAERVGHRWDKGGLKEC